MERITDRPTPTEDLGFGGVVVERTRRRFLERDGTLSVRKYGLGWQGATKIFHGALNTPWPRFLAWTVGTLLLFTGAFALGFLGLGPDALAGADTLQLNDPFFSALYFSIGLFTAVGTGPLHAVGGSANALAAVESLVGILTMVGVFGLIITKMTRPRAQVRFSEAAVIAPYRDGRGLMLRLVNRGPAELFEVNARLILVWFEEQDGKRERRFRRLQLERASVEFFPLHWTVVHPITAESPLAGVTPGVLQASQAELVVLVTAHEDMFSTRVVARTSYTGDEIRWDAKFADVFVDSLDGVITIDVERLDRLDRLTEGATRKPAALESAAS